MRGGDNEHMFQGVCVVVPCWGIAEHVLGFPVHTKTQRHRLGTIFRLQSPCPWSALAIFRISGTVHLDMNVDFTSGRKVIIAYEAGTRMLFVIHGRVA